MRQDKQSEQRVGVNGEATRAARPSLSLARVGLPGCGKTNWGEGRVTG